MEAFSQKSKTAIMTLVIVGLMALLVAFSPTLYRVFCQITGYGGTTQQSERPSDGDGIVKKINRITGNQTSVLGNITISFDSNINGGLPWDFYPQAGKMTVPIGETAVAYYHAKNNGDGKTIGQAIFNVTPHLAGQYFVKLDCFCFTEQQMVAGEERAMPVDFYIDPDIKNDPDIKDLQDITLSYTFFSLYDEDIPEVSHSHNAYHKHNEHQYGDSDGKKAH